MAYYMNRIASGFLIAASLAAPTKGSVTDSANLAARYVADQSVYNAGATDATDGQTVATWADISGNGHDVSQTTEGNKPVFQTGQQNGLPGVAFDGTNDYLFKSTYLLNDYPMSVYIVAESDDIDSNQAALSMTHNGSSTNYYAFSFLGSYAGDPVAGWARAGAVYPATTSTGYEANKTFLMSSVLSNTTDRRTWLDGAGEGLNDRNIQPNVANQNSMAIGRINDASPSDYFSGNLYEIRVYSVAHDAATRAAVEAEMNAKWGLGVPEYVDAANLQARYAADGDVYEIGTTQAGDGDTVATWVDSSGNGNDLVQSTEAEKPLFRINEQNGLPGIEFDGTDDWIGFDAPIIEDAPMSIYVVGRMDTSGAISGTMLAFLDEGGSTDYYSVGIDASGDDGVQFVARDSSFEPLVTPLGITSNQAFLATAIAVSDSLREVRLDGGSLATSALTIDPSATLTVTSVGNLQRSSPTSFYSGFIHEIRIYNVAHDATTRAAVEAEMNAKWGLGVSNVPPSVSPLTHSPSISEDYASTVSSATSVSIGSDSDGDSLSITNVEQGANSGTSGQAVQGTYGLLTVTDNGDDSYDYTYDLDEGTAAVDAISSGVVEQDVFTISVSDGVNADVTFDLTFEIDGINDLPTLDSSVADQAASEGVPFSLTLLSGVFSDVDGDALTWTVTESLSWLTVDNNNSTTPPTLHGTPGSGDVGGPFAITVKVNDGSGDSPVDTFNMTVSSISMEGSTNEQLFTNTVTGVTGADGSRIDLADSDLVIENRESASIRLSTAGSERLVVDANGTVTVNAAGASANALDVDGTVRAKKVMVDADWADFVFEEGYELRTLEEIEKHIEKYSRLPDVPSAEVIQNEGVSIGDSQSLLLRKIEELTLYLLQQSEFVEEQEKRIQELEKIIEVKKRDNE